ncbi:MAG TPA: HDIG domain-containing protein [Candidatus Hydrothermia bacterium]|nr:HDIG domain-containing protein [Candidatus Hydrothermae bacterium]MDD3649147.1 HDIG domain-containing protein [Candidatus Hydrothermia bacterium]MDD5572184.1 HDIG domain-containing protein [Candidatus Hydrothermia bacterium]HOK23087.1 HDIG domain-containing protein [Candidatus Hydrothermia bacterium]HOL23653.1 HDIG domain-containing protein [Candidatus Hydrothermia bacterium]
MRTKDLSGRTIIPRRKKKKFKLTPAFALFILLLALTLISINKLAYRLNIFEEKSIAPIVEKKIEVVKLPYFVKEAVHPQVNFDSLSVAGRIILNYFTEAMARPVIEGNFLERADTILVRDGDSLLKLPTDSLYYVSRIRLSIENLASELGIDSSEKVKIFGAILPVLKTNLTLGGFIEDTMITIEGIPVTQKSPTGRAVVLLNIYLLIVFIVAYLFYYLNFKSHMDRRKTIIFIMSILFLIVFLWFLPVTKYRILVFMFPFALMLAGFFTGFLPTLFLLFSSLFILLPLFAENLLPLIIFNLSVGFMSAYLGSNIKTRWNFLSSFIYLSIFSAVVLLVLSVFYPVPVFPHLKHVLTVNVLSVLLLFVAIPLMESILRYPTEFVLLELSNVNHKLLMRLQDEAPGTFEHSLRVAEMGSRVAPILGLDPILARVAGLYHDIGKMAHAIFFVENQRGGENPHDKVSPEMSAQILKSHVTDGIFIAKKHRLPDEIIGVISSHHGTSVMYSIYTKAVKLYQQVEKDKYRYPGPKPRNKLEALFMIVDSAEAASRALVDKTEDKFREVLNDLVDDKLKDGQFSECDITYGELERVKEEILEILLSQYHLRVKYHEDKGY